VPGIDFIFTRHLLLIAGTNLVSKWLQNDRMTERQKDRHFNQDVRDWTGSQMMMSAKEWMCQVTYVPGTGSAQANVKQDCRYLCLADRRR
jgi:hypothetical protein